MQEPGLCPSAGAEPTSKQSLKYREQESPNPAGARHLLQGVGGTAHGTQMTSRKYLEAGPGTGYGLGQSLVKGGRGEGKGSRGSDRPKKQTQAATQAMGTELPAEEKEAPALDGSCSLKRRQACKQTYKSARNCDSGSSKRPFLL